MIKKLNKNGKDECDVRIFFSNVLESCKKDAYDIVCNKLIEELKTFGIYDKDGIYIYYNNINYITLYNTNGIKDWENILCTIFDNLTSIAYDYTYTEKTQVNSLDTVEETKTCTFNFYLSYILQFKDNEYLIKYSKV